jgi:Xaa-Pro aminopeptidase
MKRGLITWDKTELRPAVFEQRLARVREELAHEELSALVVYTDVWRSNQGRYLTNFMPYWNRALIVIPHDGEPVLLCGLSPRVYPWIKSVTILSDIRPNLNLTKLREENGWTKVGVLDLPLLPYELAIDNAANVPWDAIHRAPDEAELAMYRRAAKMAREILEAELRDGSEDIVPRLELKYRRAGAEDLVIRNHNDSISVAVEYRGHWVKIARPQRDSHVELLSGPYPYEFCQESALTPGAIFARNGETYRMGPNGPELL